MGILKDKVILITGGSSGIGKSTAELVASEGAVVVIGDIQDEEGKETASKIVKNGHQASYLRMDVTDFESVKKVTEEVSSRHGRLDGAFNNAGIEGPTAKISDYENLDWKKVLDVNLTGAFLSVKGGLPILKKQKKGTIIFTSSTAGLNGFPYRSPYSASKWGIHGFMKTLAMEAGPFGIRANAIAPGCVEGARIDAVIEREAAKKNTTPDVIRKAYKSGTSLKTFVNAEDIAAMALFLASDQALRISGQVIAVDGHTENPDPKI